MKVIADWLQLTVKQYEDGNFEAYEVLTDKRREANNWSDIADWIISILDDISREV
jgi:hypothetical protein